MNPRSPVIDAVQSLLDDCRQGKLGVSFGPVFFDEEPDRMSVRDDGFVDEASRIKRTMCIQQHAPPSDGRTVEVLSQVVSGYASLELASYVGGGPEGERTMTIVDRVPGTDKLTQELYRSYRSGQLTPFVATTRPAAVVPDGKSLSTVPYLRDPLQQVIEALAFDMRNATFRAFSGLAREGVILCATSKVTGERVEGLIYASRIRGDEAQLTRVFRTAMESLYRRLGLRDPPGGVEDTAKFKDSMYEMGRQQAEAIERDLAATTAAYGAQQDVPARYLSGTYKLLEDGTGQMIQEFVAPTLQAAKQVAYLVATSLQKPVTLVAMGAGSPVVGIRPVPSPEPPKAALPVGARALDLEESERPRVTEPLPSRSVEIDLEDHDE